MATHPAWRGLLSILLLAAAVGASSSSTLAAGKIFIFRNAIRDLEEFRGYARIAARLKPYGEVQIDVGVLADKSWYDVPPGGSPWHEFGTYNASTAKFFPHPKIAPHIPGAWVAENRKLLLGKAAILREQRLEAAFSGNDTHYLPESFFREYPHLRGPRVDHPRRTRRDAFAFCLDQPETQEMLEWMIAELIRNVPQIRTIFAHQNDSGAGLCWARGQYSGPNGPAFCRARSTGERVRTMLETMQRGAAKSGGAITIRLTGTMAESEEKEFLPILPANTFLSRPWSKRNYPEGDPNIVWTGTMIADSYPVLGLIDPLRVWTTLEKTLPPEVRTVVISSSQPWYHRAGEPLETVQKLVDVIEAFQAGPVSGAQGRAKLLRALAARWGGQKNADRLASAFQHVNQAFQLKQEAVPGFDIGFEGFGAVSSRFLTRPMLIKPDLLSKEEEAYFLPHVFNIDESAAREDYRDYYGHKMVGPPTRDYAPLQQAFDEALAAARILESMPDAPEQAWLRRLGIGMRMWVCEVRSINNFYFAQELRERNAAVLAGPVRQPPGCKPPETPTVGAGTPCSGTSSTTPTSSSRC